MTQKSKAEKTVSLPETTWKKLVRTLNKCGDKAERGYDGFEYSDVYFNLADKIERQTIE